MAQDLQFVFYFFVIFSQAFHASLPPSPSVENWYLSQNENLHFLTFPETALLTQKVKKNKQTQGIMFPFPATSTSSLGL